jgi:hypothetical protein
MTGFKENKRLLPMEDQRSRVLQVACCTLQPAAHKAASSVGIGTCQGLSGAR